MTVEGAQATLTGDELDVEHVKCEKYAGKHEPRAEYAVRVLDTTLGEVIEVRCCEFCKDEFAEWLDSEKIRKLRRAERFIGQEGESQ